MMKAARQLIGVVCVFLLCNAIYGGEKEEEVERWLQRPPDYEQRLEAYERLLEMRRSLGVKHLPAATQFDFSRQRYLQPRPDGIGKTDANGCAWSSAGPTNLNGRVTAIAIDPKNNQRVYATTYGGIFRSETAGRRWQRVSDDWLATVFSSIAVNPNDTTEIFAGGGDKDLNPGYTGDGLWRSNNYGAPGSWSKVKDAAGNTPFNKSVIYRIRVDPASPNNIYVAASNGIWLGERNGAYFDFTKGPMGGCNAAVDDVAVDFSANPRNVYMAVREGPGAVSIPGCTRGIYKWDNVNAKWLKKDSGIATVDTEVILLGLAVSNPKVLYAKVTRTNGTHQGFYRTTTAAEGNPAWKKTAGSATLDDCGGFCWFSNTVEVDPTNEKRVIASGGWPYVSTDGGDNFDWVYQGTDPDFLAEVHGDMHTAAFDPNNPNIVYVGNDGGIDKSTDMSNPKWHWIDSSHGMVASMFYNLTSNRDYPTTLAGGSQDNGIDITFGNRTWYRPVWCDGLDVGTDAKNPINLYASCNGGLTEFANPIPGTDGGGSQITFVSATPPKGPVATDVNISGAAIASSGDPCSGETIITTTDGVNWKPSGASFTTGYTVAAIAIAESSSFKSFLAAVTYVQLNPAQCPGISLPLPSLVIRSDDGGASWTTAFGLPTNQAPKSLAFDPKDKNRSYVLYETSQKIYMSTGGNYAPIGAGLPAQTTRMVVDPWDSNVLYVATPIGVFRGVVTPSSPPSATWTPFDEGLPDGLDVNDLWVDPKSGILTIGTFGHGAYRRNITPGAKCTPKMLVVRDNVYDDGREPDATVSWPDAEHPIKDVSKPGGFYKPDNTIGGRVWWYKSHDIRVDVPSMAPPQNQIPDADSVEFELCPITAWPCEPGGMLDLPPVASEKARVYVQVTNRGLEPVTKTRVIALWTKSATGAPDLPESFWKTTFPFNAPCGALDESTGWHLIDKPGPCRMIDSVNPEVPEVARFDWMPPLDATGGATILTVIESAEDPIEESIRKENKRVPHEIVPGSRHIALRNIKVVPFDYGVREPFLWPIDFPHIPYEPMGDTEIVVSQPDLREGTRIVLPAGMTARAGLGSARQTKITEPALVRQLESMRLDPANAWELTGNDASLLLSLRPGERVTAGVIATPGDATASSRFQLTQRMGEKVVGGLMVLFRPQGEKR